MNSQGSLNSNIGPILGKKMCLLCFKKIEENSLLYSPKLLKLCFQYLHSGLTQENLEIPTNEETIPLCLRCLDSAKKLVDFSDKLKFYQKSISDLTLIFSLEILHRRGKIEDVDNVFQSTYSKNDHDESQTFLSSSWSCPKISENTYTSPVTIPVSTKHKTNYISNRVIKCGSIQFDWIDKNVEDVNDGATKLSAVQEIENLDPIFVPDKNEPEIINHQRLEFSTNVGHCDDQKEPIENAVHTKVSPTCAKNPDNKRHHFNERETFELIESFPTSVTTDPLFPSIPTVSETEPFYEMHCVEEVESPVYCSQCPKLFLQSRDLLIHLQNDHKKQKPFKCLTCGKEFEFKCHLKVHIRTHTKEKPFKCPTCSKRFYQNHDLVRHIRTHTGEKPFQCDQCDYAAVQLHALQAHKKRHLNLKYFKCKECERKFKSVDNLKSHFKRIHFALDFSDDCIVKYM